jgi:predicted enzyme related to lactoylglutathione lyase
MAQEQTGMPTTPVGNGKHPITWVEIRAVDLARAAAFYRAAFGWELTPFGDSYMVHWADGILGMGFSSGWSEELGTALFYVSVPDIDAVVNQAVEEGATVIEPKQPIGPDMPNSAVVRNAQGVHVGLFDGAKSPQPYIPAPWNAPQPVQPNTICSVEIHGGLDLATAQRFYGGLFGWGLAEPAGQYMMYDPGAGVGGVFQSHTPQAPVMIYIYVDDVAATLARIEAAGGSRLGEPMAMPGMGVFGYFKDANGVALGLIGPADA